MKEMSDFLERHGDSTVLTCKVFSPLNEKDANILKIGISLHIKSLSETSSSELLFIQEQIDEEMAELMQDYRGYLLNFAIPAVLDEKDSISLLEEFSYGLNFLKIKHEVIGFNVVENNV